MSKNLFDYPEIRCRLALFVSVKDALSCILVSKAFAQDFAYPIWHTIDYGTQKKFIQLNSAILNTYGHHIRVVKGIKTKAQLDPLLNLGAAKLLSLDLTTTMDASFQASCYDLVRQNQATLTQLKICNATIERATSKFIFLDSLTSMTGSLQSSKLTALTIQWLTLTRGSLTFVLRCCPALVSIDLWGTILTSSGKFDDYQHAGVTQLESIISDSFQEGSLPLLVHFPNLELWKTGLDCAPSAFPTQAVKDSMSRWCPKLKKIETNSTPALLLPHVIVNVFVGVTSLMFKYSEISSSVIAALLRYPANWRVLSTYVFPPDFYSLYEEDGAARIQNHFQGSSWMLQSVLCCCHNLKAFRFPDHEMDMNEAEQVAWASKDLEDFRVRIKGLDTRDKIEGTIARWREGRIQKKMGMTIEVLDGKDKEDESIEARTARHLLQFDKLRTLWLGCKLWTA